MMLDSIIETLVYLVLMLVLFVAGRLFYRLFHPRILVTDELIHKDNFAFSWSYVGYLTGLIIVIVGVTVGDSKGWLMDTFEILVYGVLAIVLLNLGTLINDKIILKQFSIEQEIVRDRNVGMGVIEAANAISIGLVIYGAITGDALSWTEGIFSTIAFWIIGQIVLLICTRFYNLIVPYNLYKEIEKDNNAVAVAYAGALVAFSNLIRFTISDEFISWQETGIDILIDLGIAILLLPIARWLCDRILLPGRKLTDELVNQDVSNVGAGLIEAFVYVASSILITSIL